MRYEMTEDYARWTIEQIDAGKTKEQMAEYLCVKPITIEKRLLAYKKRYGLSPRRIYRRYTEIAIKFAIKRISENRSYEQIVDELERLHPENRRLKPARLKRLVAEHLKRLSKVRCA